MPLVNVRFRNSNISLVSDDEERLCKLAERFNQRVDMLASNANNVTDQKLAFMAGLILEDEIEAMQTQLLKRESLVVKKEDNVNTELLCDMMDQISSYLEQLAVKLEKR